MEIQYLDKSNIVRCPQYSFDSFVVGENNRLAYSTSWDIANLKKGYNPLFIYGNPGSGKTHLLNAIFNHILTDYSNMKICFLPCHDYLDSLLYSIKNDASNEFWSQLKGFDLLLIDDIHTMHGKEATQAEFINVFCDLHILNKQVVVSSGLHPDYLKKLSEGIQSRLEDGLIVGINSPDLETRINILKKKSAVYPINTPSDNVLIYIAQNSGPDIRQLEGILNNVVQYCLLNKCNLSLDLAKKLVDNLLGKNKETDGD